MKQELVIVDPTASVKVILWEQFLDTLKEDQTYVFKNLRLKRENNGSMYLNTPKSDQFSFEECEEFAETVVQDIQLFSSVEVCASIIGVESISTYQACMKCGKKAVLKNGKILKCEACQMLQKIAPANKRWFLRCLFANLINEEETISLAIFNENVKAMVDLIPQPICLSDVAPDDLSEALLSMPDVKITYDSVANKLINIANIGI